jgi:hypothetical protein
MAVTIDGSAGVTTNAGGAVNPSTNISGINYSCRAWVNFNGTGTVAIRASGNVSSISDMGTGDYMVNFTTAMVDANYSAVSTAVAAGTADFQSPLVGAPLAESCRFYTSNGTVVTDTGTVCIAVFR